MPDRRLTMKHPDIEVTARVTQRQFDALYKGNGWTIVDDTEAVTREDLAAKARKRSGRKASTTQG